MKLLLIEQQMQPFCRRRFLTPNPIANHMSDHERAPTSSRPR
jgi:hypothetical protein